MFGCPTFFQRIGFLFLIPTFSLNGMCVAQEIYSPLKTHSEESAALIRGLRDQFEDAMAGVESPRKQAVRQVYFQRTHSLIRSITQRIYIADEFLQEKVDDVMRRLVDSNSLSNVPKRILIQKNPIPNALCYGEGTFVVTIGLLANISDESQLGFALAHELAHYELDHVKNRILQQVERDYLRKTRTEIAKVLNGSGDAEDVSALRELVYGESRFNREVELKADSLGFIIFRNAGYNEGEALSLLSVLDSAGTQTPIGPELFLPFHTTKLPFQDHWVRPRLSVYRKTYDNTFFFRNDSITSHPDIEMRQQILEPLISHKGGPVNLQPDAEVRQLIRISQFEAVESAYFLRQFDRCIHLALRLWYSYPNDSYLVSVISKVLIDLYKTKETMYFPMLVPAYTGYYNQELRRVNDFLNNLTKEEFGDIAYNFLNSDLHFDDENEDHYYLLWKLCELTRRRELQKKVKEVYLERFTKGKFTMDMR
jgi:hypothetical protein